MTGISRRDLQNNGGTRVGGVTGKGFMPGRSGNAGGCPRGLARVAREVVGDDGLAIAQFWFDVMHDADAKMGDRIEASRLLAERGWGRAAGFALVEDEDPLGLDRVRVDAAIDTFAVEVVRLADVSRGIRQRRQR